MYYHVLIEINEKANKATKDKICSQFDLTDLDEIKSRYVEPYLNNEVVHFDGYLIKSESITRFTIRQSENTSSEMVDIAYSKLGPNVLIMIRPASIVLNPDYTTDITQSIFDAARLNKKIKSPAHAEKPTDPTTTRKVFIVHGHDDHAKLDAARCVEKLEYQAVILHEQASSGKTIIEKIEANSDVAFAVVLYTPCDLGHSLRDSTERNRARQNVVFEHGFLIGRLGRAKVCALVKGDIETPNDISGVVYITMDSAGGWRFALAKEMKAAGCDVDLNSL